LESNLPGLDCIVDAAALAICSSWTTIRSSGLCGLLHFHEGWWHSGLAILASFFRHFCSVQCAAARGCIDFLTSREEVHQQHSFGILDDCGYNLAHRVHCFEILCWRGIICVSSMTCAPMFHYQWQLGLAVPHWSVCTEAGVISINSYASVCGVHSLALGPNMQLFSCDKESHEQFPALLVNVEFGHNVVYFHVCCNEQCLPHDMLSFDVSVEGLKALVHHISSAILECFAPQGTCFLYTVTGQAPFKFGSVFHLMWECKSHLTPPCWSRFPVSAIATTLHTCTFTTVAVCNRNVHPISIFWCSNVCHCTHLWAAPLCTILLEQPP